MQKNKIYNKNQLLMLWKALKPIPLGKNMFSRILCHKIPYFKTISPEFLVLRKGYCEVKMPMKRFIINHLGSVHAIAMCNLAELVGGSMAEVTIPKQFRWIPNGMQVEYLHQAKTDLVGRATTLIDPEKIQAGDFCILVELYDLNQQLVFRANINMWLSLK